MDPRALGEVSFHEGRRMAGPKRAAGHWGVFFEQNPVPNQDSERGFHLLDECVRRLLGDYPFRSAAVFAAPGRLLPGWLLPGRLLPLFPGRGFHVFPGRFPRSFPEDDSRSSFRHGAPRLPLPPPSSHSAVICGHPRGRRRRYGGCDVRAECRCQGLHWPHSG